MAALLSTMQTMVISKKRNKRDDELDVKYPAFKRSKPTESRLLLDRNAKSNVATPPSIGKTIKKFPPSPESLSDALVDELAEDNEERGVPPQSIQLDLSKEVTRSEDEETQ